MIAHFSIPGSNSFTWRRVATHAAGVAWINAQLGANPTQADLQAHRQSGVISERVAARVRWLDGSRVYSEFSADDSESAEEKAAMALWLRKKDADDAAAAEAWCARNPV